MSTTDKYLEKMNPFALTAAMDLVVGQAARERVEESYHYIKNLLEQAHTAGFNDANAEIDVDGFTQGFRAGLSEADGDAEQAAKDGFDAGFDAGYNEGRLVGQADSEEAEELGYDDGYADGVRDARVSPTIADAYIRGSIPAQEAPPLPSHDFILEREVFAQAVALDPTIR